MTSSTRHIKVCHWFRGRTLDLINDIILPCQIVTSYVNFFWNNEFILDVISAKLFLVCDDYKIQNRVGYRRYVLLWK